MYWYKSLHCWVKQTNFKIIGMHYIYIKISTKQKEKKSRIPSKKFDKTFEQSL